MTEQLNNLESFIIDLQCFASINCIKTSIKHRNIIFLLYEFIEKSSFANRYIVAGSNGLIHLSIPLEKGRGQKLPFKDIRIANQHAWQSHHWKTIQSCYGRSPYFEYYADGLMPFFEKQYHFLADFNLEIMKCILKLVQYKGSVTMYTEKENLDMSDYSDFRNYWTPRNYNQQPSPVYPQPFEDKIGFQPNLSCIDALFCMGASFFTL